MDTDPYRIISLIVLPDPVAYQKRCLEMGFSSVEINVPGCLVLRAGDSYLALATAESMAANYGPESMASLVGRATPYVYVPSLDASKERLGENAVVRDEVVSNRGTREALVEFEGQRMIIAQQLYR